MQRSVFIERNRNNMGMYDEIICKYPLPDPELQYRVFQTKDLENNMCHYSITSEGRLVLFPWMVDEYSCQYIRNMEDPKIIDFDGDLVFYTFFMENSIRKWYEYIARFDNGKLICIDKAVYE